LLTWLVWFYGGIGGRYGGCLGYGLEALVDVGV